MVLPISISRGTMPCRVPSASRRKGLSSRGDSRAPRLVRSSAIGRRHGWRPGAQERRARNARIGADRPDDDARLEGVTTMRAILERRWFADTTWPWGIVAVAWALTLLALLTGRTALLDHDALLGSGTLPGPLALLLFLAAWQVMTAAMMLPSSLPMMRLFA